MSQYRKAPIIPATEIRLHSIVVTFSPLAIHKVPPQTVYITFHAEENGEDCFGYFCSAKIYLT